MKKLFLFLFIIFYASAFAISSGPGFFAEFGRSVIEGNETPEDNKNYIAYTDIEIHYNFKLYNFFVIPYGEIKTWFLTDENIFRDDHPFCDIYSVGLKIKYMDITLYCEHYCAHPVYSEGKMWQVEDYRMKQNSDKIAIKYEFN